MRLTYFFFLFLGIVQANFAQQDAWVYFSQKSIVAFAIENPKTMLSQQAIDRRKTQGIPFDAQDVPIDPNYIKRVKSLDGVEVLAKSKWLNALHVRGSEEAIRRLSTLDFVDSIDFAAKNLADMRNSKVHKDKFATESQLDYDYGLAYNQVAMLHLNALHKKNYTGSKIVIAVLDAGFPKVDKIEAFNRLRKNGGLLGGYDFVDRTTAIYNPSGNSHGTKVLSTMAAYIENEYVGTAPDASFYLFRTESDSIENPVEESYWVEAAERADSLGVHIINSSLGYNTFDNANYNYTPSDMDGKTTFISRGANIASQKGILVVNAAGNEGNGTWGIVTAPADAPGVFTVGAVNGSGVYAPFSSRGSGAQPTQKPDVVAQGAGSWVVDNNDYILNNSGTSLSSPIMAGALACLWQALPKATAEEIKKLVRLSASQSNAPDDYLGYGIPDFDTALALGLSLTDAKTNSYKIYPNPVNDLLFIQSSTKHPIADVALYNLLGKKILETTLKSKTGNREVDVSGLMPGLYILRIRSQDENFTFKFIKS